MRVLALDIAKRQTGWAVGSTETPVISFGVFTTDHKFLPPWDGYESKHVARFWDFIGDVHKRHGFDSIMYEENFLDVARFNPAGTKATLYFIAMLMLFTQQRDIALNSVAIQTWRGRFVPGNAPKGLKNAYARRQWWKKRSIEACKLRGWKVGNSDEAEALGILDYALSEKDPHFAGSSDPIFHLDRLMAP